MQFNEYEPLLYVDLTDDTTRRKERRNRFFQIFTFLLIVVGVFYATNYHKQISNVALTETEVSVGEVLTKEVGGAETNNIGNIGTNVKEIDEETAVSWCAGGYGYSCESEQVYNRVAEGKKCKHEEEGQGKVAGLKSCSHYCAKKGTHFAYGKNSKCSDGNCECFCATATKERGYCEEVDNSDFDLYEYKQRCSEARYRGEFQGEEWKEKPVKGAAACEAMCCLEPECVNWNYYEKEERWNRVSEALWGKLELKRCVLKKKATDRFKVNNDYVCGKKLFMGNYTPKQVRDYCVNTKTDDVNPCDWELDYACDWRDAKGRKGWAHDNDVYKESLEHEACCVKRRSAKQSCGADVLKCEFRYLDTSECKCSSSQDCTLQRCNPNTRENDFCEDLEGSNNGEDTNCHGHRIMQHVCKKAIDFKGIERKKEKSPTNAQCVAKFGFEHSCDRKLLPENLLDLLGGIMPSNQFDKIIDILATIDDLKKHAPAETLTRLENLFVKIANNPTKINKDIINEVVELLIEISELPAIQEFAPQYVKDTTAIASVLKKMSNGGAITKDEIITLLSKISKYVDGLNLSTDVVNGMSEIFSVITNVESATKLTSTQIGNIFKTVDKMFPSLNLQGPVADSMTNVISVFQTLLTGGEITSAQEVNLLNSIMKSVPLITGIILQEKDEKILKAIKDGLSNTITSINTLAKGESLSGTQYDALLKSITAFVPLLPGIPENLDTTAINQISEKIAKVLEVVLSFGEDGIDATKLENMINKGSELIKLLLPADQTNKVDDIRTDIISVLKVVLTVANKNAITSDQLVSLVSTAKSFLSLAGVKLDADLVTGVNEVITVVFAIAEGKEIDTDKIKTLIKTAGNIVASYRNAISYQRVARWKVCKGWGHQIGKVASVDECANACKNKSIMFVYGNKRIDKWNRCSGNPQKCACWCESSTFDYFSCEYEDHKGYDLYMFKEYASKKATTELQVGTLALPQMREERVGTCNENLSGPGDKNYRGCQTKTRSGRTCQAWNSQSPHGHNRTPSRYPNDNLIQNYCRNPDGEPTIWCYTTDPAKRWELCNPLPMVCGGDYNHKCIAECWSNEKCWDTKSTDYGFCRRNCDCEAGTKNYCKAQSTKTCYPSDCEIVNSHATASGNYPNCVCTCTDGWSGQKCTTPPQASDVKLRLVGGSVEWNGRLEVFFNGRWGTVCDDIFGKEEAKVACRQLNFGDPISWDDKSGAYSDGSHILLDNLECTGEENYLAQCNSNGWGEHNCNGWEDVSITCFGPPLCDSSDCNEHGSATGRRPNCACTCTFGWTGDDCNIAPDFCDVNRCLVRCDSKYSNSNDSYMCKKGCAGMGGGKITNKNRFCPMHQGTYDKCYSECSNASSSSANVNRCRYGCEIWKQNKNLLYGQVAVNTKCDGAREEQTGTYATLYECARACEDKGKMFIYGNDKKCYCETSTKNSNDCTYQYSQNYHLYSYENLVASDLTFQLKKQYDMTAENKVCRGDRIDIGKIGTLNKCAIACAARSRFFIYGKKRSDNKNRCHGSNPQKCNCYCETSTNESQQCEYQDHNGYNVYEYKTVSDTQYKYVNGKSISYNVNGVNQVCKGNGLDVGRFATVNECAIACATKSRMFTYGNKRSDNKNRCYGSNPQLCRCYCEVMTNDRQYCEYEIHDGYNVYEYEGVSIASTEGDHTSVMVNDLTDGVMNIYTVGKQLANGDKFDKAKLGTVLKSAKIFIRTLPNFQIDETTIDQTTATVINAFDTFSKIVSKTQLSSDDMTQLVTNTMNFISQIPGVDIQQNVVNDISTSVGDVFSIATSLMKGSTLDEATLMKLVSTATTVINLNPTMNVDPKVVTTIQTSIKDVYGVVVDVGKNQLFDANHVSKLLLTATNILRILPEVTVDKTVTDQVSTGITDVFTIGLEISKGNLSEAQMLQLLTTGSKFMKLIGLDVQQTTVDTISNGVKELNKVFTELANGQNLDGTKLAKLLSTTTSFIQLAPGLDTNLVNQISQNIGETIPIIEKVVSGNSITSSDISRLISTSTNLVSLLPGISLDTSKIKSLSTSVVSILEAITDLAGGQNLSATKINSVVTQITELIKQVPGTNIDVATIDEISKEIVKIISTVEEVASGTSANSDKVFKLVGESSQLVKSLSGISLPMDKLQKVKEISEGLHTVVDVVLKVIKNKSITLTEAQGLVQTLVKTASSLGLKLDSIIVDEINSTLTDAFSIILTVSNGNNITTAQVEKVVQFFSKIFKLIPGVPSDLVDDISSNMSEIIRMVKSLTGKLTKNEVPSLVKIGTNFGKLVYKMIAKQGGFPGLISDMNSKLDKVSTSLSDIIVLVIDLCNSSNQIDTNKVKTLVQSATTLINFVPGIKLDLDVAKKFSDAFAELFTILSSNGSMNKEKVMNLFKTGMKIVNLLPGVSLDVNLDEITKTIDELFNLIQSLINGEAIDSAKIDKVLKISTKMILLLPGHGLDSNILEKATGGISTISKVLLPMFSGSGQTITTAKVSELVTATGSLIELISGKALDSNLLNSISTGITDFEPIVKKLVANQKISAQEISDLLLKTSTNLLKILPGVNIDENKVTEFSNAVKEILSTVTEFSSGTAVTVEKVSKMLTAVTKCLALIPGIELDVNVLKEVTDNATDLLQSFSNILAGNQVSDAQIRKMIITGSKLLTLIPQFSVDASTVTTIVDGTMKMLPLIRDLNNGSGVSNAKIVAIVKGSFESLNEIPGIDLSTDLVDRISGAMETIRKIASNEKAITQNEVSQLMLTLTSLIPGIDMKDTTANQISTLMFGIKKLANTNDLTPEDIAAILTNIANIVPGITLEANTATEISSVITIVKKIANGENINVDAVSNLLQSISGLANVIPGVHVNDVTITSFTKFMKLVETMSHNMNSVTKAQISDVLTTFNNLVPGVDLGDTTIANISELVSSLQQIVKKKSATANDYSQLFLLICKFIPGVNLSEQFVANLETSAQTMQTLAKGGPISTKQILDVVVTIGQFADVDVQQATVDKVSNVFGAIENLYIAGTDVSVDQIKSLLINVADLSPSVPFDASSINKMADIFVTLQDVVKGNDVTTTQVSQVLKTIDDFVPGITLDAKTVKKLSEIFSEVLAYQDLTTEQLTNLLIKLTEFVPGLTISSKNLKQLSDVVKTIKEIYNGDAESMKKMTKLLANILAMIPNSTLTTDEINQIIYVLSKLQNGDSVPSDKIALLVVNLIPNIKAETVDSMSKVLNIIQRISHGEQNSITVDDVSIVAKTILGLLPGVEVDSAKLDKIFDVFKIVTGKEKMNAAKIETVLTSIKIVMPQTANSLTQDVVTKLSGALVTIMDIAASGGKITETQITTLLTSISSLLPGANLDSTVIKKLANVVKQIQKLASGGSSITIDEVSTVLISMSNMIPGFSLKKETVNEISSILSTIHGLSKGDKSITLDQLSALLIKVSDIIPSMINMDMTKLKEITTIFSTIEALSTGKASLNSQMISNSLTLVANLIPSLSIDEQLVQQISEVLLQLHGLSQNASSAVTKISNLMEILKIVYAGKDKLSGAEITKFIDTIDSLIPGAKFDETTKQSIKSDITQSNSIEFAVGASLNSNLIAFDTFPQEIAISAQEIAIGAKLSAKEISDALKKIGTLLSAADIIKKETMDGIVELLEILDNLSCDSTDPSCSGKTDPSDQIKKILNIIQTMSPSIKFNPAMVDAVLKVVPIIQDLTSSKSKMDSKKISTILMEIVDIVPVLSGKKMNKNTRSLIDKAVTTSIDFVYDLINEHSLDISKVTTLMNLVFEIINLNSNVNISPSMMTTLSKSIGDILTIIIEKANNVEMTDAKITKLLTASTAFLPLIPNVGTTMSNNISSALKNVVQAVLKLQSGNSLNSDDISKLVTMIRLLPGLENLDSKFLNNVATSIVAELNLITDLIKGEKITGDKIGKLIQTTNELAAIVPGTKALDAKTIKLVSDGIVNIFTFIKKLTEGTEILSHDIAQVAESAFNFIKLVANLNMEENVQHNIANAIGDMFSVFKNLLKGHTLSPAEIKNFVKSLAEFVNMEKGKCDKLSNGVVNIVGVVMHAIKSEPISEVEISEMIKSTATILSLSPDVTLNTDLVNRIADAISSVFMMGKNVVKGTPIQASQIHSLVTALTGFLSLPTEKSNKIANGVSDVYNVVMEILKAEKKDLTESQLKTLLKASTELIQLVPGVTVDPKMMNLITDGVNNVFVMLKKYVKKETIGQMEIENLVKTVGNLINKLNPNVDINANLINKLATAGSEIYGFCTVTQDGKPYEIANLLKVMIDVMQFVPGVTINGQVVTKIADEAAEILKIIIAVSKGKDVTASQTSSVVKSLGNLINLIPGVSLNANTIKTVSTSVSEILKLIMKMAKDTSKINTEEVSSLVTSMTALIKLIPNMKADTIDKVSQALVNQLTIIISMVSGNGVTAEQITNFVKSSTALIPLLSSTTLKDTTIQSINTEVSKLLTDVLGLVQAKDFKVTQIPSLIADFTSFLNIMPGINIDKGFVKKISNGFTNFAPLVMNLINGKDVTSGDISNVVSAASELVLLVPNLNLDSKVVSDFAVDISVAIPDIMNLVKGDEITAEKISTLIKHSSKLLNLVGVTVKDNVVNTLTTATSEIFDVMMGINKGNGLEASQISKLVDNAENLVQLLPGNFLDRQMRIVVSACATTTVSLIFNVSNGKSVSSAEVSTFVKNFAALIESISGKKLGIVNSLSDGMANVFVSAMDMMKEKENISEDQITKLISSSIELFGMIPGTSMTWGNSSLLNYLSNELGGVVHLFNNIANGKGIEFEQISSLLKIGLGFLPGINIENNKDMIKNINDGVANGFDMYMNLVKGNGVTSEQMSKFIVSATNLINSVPGVNLQADKVKQFSHGVNVMMTTIVGLISGKNDVGSDQISNLIKTTCGLLGTIPNVNLQGTKCDLISSNTGKLYSIISSLASGEAIDSEKISETFSVGVSLLNLVPGLQIDTNTVKEASDFVSVVHKLISGNKNLVANDISKALKTINKLVQTTKVKDTTINQLSEILLNVRSLINGNGFTKENMTKLLSSMVEVLTGTKLDSKVMKQIGNLFTTVQTLAKDQDAAVDSLPDIVSTILGLVDLMPNVEVDEYKIQHVSNIAEIMKNLASGKTSSSDQIYKFFKTINELVPKLHFDDKTIKNISSMFTIIQEFKSDDNSVVKYNSEAITKLLKVIIDLIPDMYSIDKGLVDNLTEVFKMIESFESVDDVKSDDVVKCLKLLSKFLFPDLQLDDTTMKNMSTVLTEIQNLATSKGVSNISNLVLAISGLLPDVNLSNDTIQKISNALSMIETLASGNGVTAAQMSNVLKIMVTFVPQIKIEDQKIDDLANIVVSIQNLSAKDITTQKVAKLVQKLVDIAPGVDIDVTTMNKITNVASTIEAFLSGKDITVPQIATALANISMLVPGIQLDRNGADQIAQIIFLIQDLASGKEISADKFASVLQTMSDGIAAINLKSDTIKQISNVLESITVMATKKKITTDLLLNIFKSMVNLLPGEGMKTETVNQISSMVKIIEKVVSGGEIGADQISSLMKTLTTLIPGAQMLQKDTVNHISHVIATLASGDLTKLNAGHISLLLDVSALIPGVEPLDPKKANEIADIFTTIYYVSKGDASITADKVDLLLEELADVLPGMKLDVKKIKAVSNVLRDIHKLTVAEKSSITLESVLKILKDISGLIPGMETVKDTIDEVSEVLTTLNLHRDFQTSHREMATKVSALFETMKTSLDNKSMTLEQISKVVQTICFLIPGGKSLDASTLKKIANTIQRAKSATIEVEVGSTAVQLEMIDISTEKRHKDIDNRLKKIELAVGGSSSPVKNKISNIDTLLSETTPSKDSKSLPAGINLLSSWFMHLGSSYVQIAETLNKNMCYGDWPLVDEVNPLDGKVTSRSWDGDKLEGSLANKGCKAVLAAGDTGMVSGFGIQIPVAKIVEAIATPKPSSLEKIIGLNSYDSMKRDTWKFVNNKYCASWGQDKEQSRRHNTVQECKKACMKDVLCIGCNWLCGPNERYWWQIPKSVGCSLMKDSGCGSQTHFKIASKPRSYTIQTTGKWLGRKCLSGGWGFSMKGATTASECRDLVANNPNCGDYFYFGCDGNTDGCICGAKKNEAKCSNSDNWSNGSSTCKLAKLGPASSSIKKQGFYMGQKNQVCADVGYACKPITTEKECSDGILKAHGVAHDSKVVSSSKNLPYGCSIENKNGKVIMKFNRHPDGKKSANDRPICECETWSACPTNNLNHYTGDEDMKNAGWKFEKMTTLYTNNVFAGSNGNGMGKMSYKLKGSGSFWIVYANGNSLKQYSKNPDNWVRVLLNDEEIDNSRRGADTAGEYIHINVEFKDGDILALEENRGIIWLDDINFKCKGDQRFEFRGAGCCSADDLGDGELAYKIQVTYAKCKSLCNLDPKCTSFTTDAKEDMSTLGTCWKYHGNIDNWVTNINCNLAGANCYAKKKDALWEEYGDNRKCQETTSTKMTLHDSSSCQTLAQQYNHQYFQFETKTATCQTTDNCDNPIKGGANEDWRMYSLKSERIPNDCWTVIHNGQWCTNRITINDDLSFEECVVAILSNSECDPNYMQRDNGSDRCKCVPKDESCALKRGASQVWYCDNSMESNDNNDPIGTQEENTVPNTNMNLLKKLVPTSNAQSDVSSYFPTLDVSKFVNYAPDLCFAMNECEVNNKKSDSFAIGFGPGTSAIIAEFVPAIGRIFASLVDVSMGLGWSAGGHFRAAATYFPGGVPADKVVPDDKSIKFEAQLYTLFDAQFAGWSKLFCEKVGDYLSGCTSDPLPEMISTQASIGAYFRFDGNLLAQVRACIFGDVLNNCDPLGLITGSQFLLQAQGKFGINLSKIHDMLPDINVNVETQALKTSEGIYFSMWINFKATFKNVCKNMMNQIADLVDPCPENSFKVDFWVSSTDLGFKLEISGGHIMCSLIYETTHLSCLVPGGWTLDLVAPTSSSRRALTEAERIDAAHDVNKQIIVKTLCYDCDCGVVIWAGSETDYEVGDPICDGEWTTVAAVEEKAHQLGEEAEKQLIVIEEHMLSTMLEHEKTRKNVATRSRRT